MATDRLRKDAKRMHTTAGWLAAAMDWGAQPARLETISDVFRKLPASFGSVLSPS
jgi:hypothetical protein